MFSFGHRWSPLRTIFPCALPWLAALVLVCGLPLGHVLAQQLPPQATTRFHQAIEHLRGERYALAEELLSQLMHQFPDQADVHEALAMVFVFQGKAQAATAHFEKVVRLKPGSAQARQNLGANYLRLGRIDEAEREFRAALKLQPDNPTVHYNLGSLYLSERNFQRALPHLEQTYKRQPHIFENAHKLALCYFFLRRHEEAAKILAGLAPGDRQAAEFLILLGLNHKVLGEEAAAKSAFDQALRALPSYPEAYETLGQMFFELGLFAEAIPIFERAFTNHPDSYPVAYGLATAYQGAGQLEEARATVQSALQKWQTADLHHLLGEVNEKLRNYVEAVQHFQRAVELEPSERNVFDLGYELLVHWNWDSALTVFQQAVKLYPQSQRLWLGLGTAYFGQGDYNQATEALLQAVAAAPDNPMTYHLLANVYPVSRGFTKAVQQQMQEFQQRHPDDPWANYYYAMSLGRPPDEQPAEVERSEAIRLLRRAVTLKRDLPEAHYQLGLLLSEQGQWQQALAALKAAVRLKPDYVAAHYRLALAYRRTGKADQAKAALAQYQALKAKQESELERRAGETIRFINSLKP